MKHLLWLGGLSAVLLGAGALPSQGQSPEDLLEEALAALEKGQPARALTLADKAVEKDPASVNGHLVRGFAHEALGNHAKAMTAFDRVIALDPNRADAYNHRGSVAFQMGKIKESVADFDRYLELRPAQRAGHWKRGISLYYLGRYEDGKTQFKGYESVDTNDVENAVWHFLCNARLVGVEKARKEILKIGKDRRVPMMKVYDLFAGRANPEDVLRDARAGEPDKETLNRQLFYAHLYLGLYQEILGDRKAAQEHLTRATEHRIGHYMWDVARVGRQTLGESTRK